MTLAASFTESLVRDFTVIPAVAALPGVHTVRQLHDYQLDLSETVPYIGATAVQNVGFNGAGVRVAVLDTGIDYTHKFFGGPGTAAAYTAAYGTTTADTRNTTTDGLFPTAKVVGGFDFVGERWPSGPLAPDPDPIDCGPSAIAAPCAGGHGTTRPVATIERLDCRIISQNRHSQVETFGGGLDEKRFLVVKDLRGGKKQCDELYWSFCC